MSVTETLQLFIILEKGCTKQFVTICVSQIHLYDQELVAQQCIFQIILFLT